MLKCYIKIKGRVRMKKKAVSIVLTVILIISSLTVLPTTAVSAAGTSKTQDEALAWVKSQVGNYLDMDGYYGAQCVDLILAYYDFLGVPRSSGNGTDYRWNTLPSGFSRIEGATPQPGDVLVYSGTGDGIYQYGHVAIFESTYSHYHQNYAGHSYVEQVTGVAYNAFTVTPYWGVIRPNFSDKWYASMTPVNIGEDVYASILKNDTQICLANVNDNVELADKGTISDDSEKWHFVRQSDGSYIIYNCYDGKALDVSDAGTSEGTNVGVYPYWGHDAQHWFIYGTANGQYYLKPRLCDLVLDLNNNENSYGTNAQLWTYNASTAQQMYIDILPTANASELNVVAGDFETLTEFMWEESDDTIYYDLIIKTGTPDNLADYQTINYIQNNYFAYELPVGYYEVYLEVHNSYSSSKSNVVKFNVTAKPVVGEDGWIYADALKSDITSDEYDIEYLHTYDQIASSSPGDDWVQGDYAKTEYVNSGEPYWSNIELATSDTRVLVNYIYYHYCSGSTGLEVNYEYTSTFTHYDWLSKDGVYEYSVANDYADSRYKFYRLKWSSSGSDAYCSSGTTCDGAYGSHGSRSYYWYKSSQYQDRVAVDYYHYTKDSTWTAELDDTATAVTYRYKLKESDFLLGDVNNDGVVNVMDATELQKHIAGTTTLDGEALLRGDVNSDGAINVNDATLIQKYSASLITEF